VVVINPTPPPPVVVVTEAPAQPPEEVDVPYPVPVYAGIVTLNPPDAPSRSRNGQPPAAAKPAPSLPAAVVASGSTSPAASGNSPRAPLANSGGRRPAPPREKQFQKPGEYEVASAAIQDVEGRHFAKALAELDTWTQKFGESDFKVDRLYYYVLAYHGAQDPAKVVDTAAKLLSSGAEKNLQDPRQIILALYLTSLSIQKLPYPSHEQFVTGQLAARNLLEFVPAYFTDANRPAGTSQADWSKAQGDLENAAKTTLSSLAKRQSGRH
jgi:hypothetical protein